MAVQNVNKGFVYITDFTAYLMLQISNVNKVTKSTFNKDTRIRIYVYTVEYVQFYSLSI